MTKSSWAKKTTTSKPSALLNTSKPSGASGSVTRIFMDQAKASKRTSCAADTPLPRGISAPNFLSAISNAAIAVITLVNEGGLVLISERRFGMPAGLRFYPIAILIAGLSVALSRLIDLHPGVIFGFVASAAVLGDSGLDRRQRGVLYYIPMACLLVTAVVAFLLISPLREISESETA